jgi:hypothetical protein
MAPWHLAIPLPNTSAAPPEQSSKFTITKNRTPANNPIAQKVLVIYAGIARGAG